MSSGLTKAQREMLSELNRDDEVYRPPSNRWAQELTIRALIDRGLINPVGWTLTDAGRQALKEPTNTTEETK